MLSNTALSVLTQEFRGRKSSRRKSESESPLADKRHAQGHSPNCAPHARQLGSDVGRNVAVKRMRGPLINRIALVADRLTLIRRHVEHERIPPCRASAYRTALLRTFSPSNLN